MTLLKRNDKTNGAESRSLQRPSCYLTWQQRAPQGYKKNQFFLLRSRNRGQDIWKLGGGGHFWRFIRNLHLLGKRISLRIVFLLFTPKKDYVNHKCSKQRLSPRKETCDHVQKSCLASRKNVGGESNSNPDKDQQKRFLHIVMSSSFAEAAEKPLYWGVASIEHCQQNKRLQHNGNSR